MFWHRAKEYMRSLMANVRDHVSYGEPQSLTQCSNSPLAHVICIFIYNIQNSMRIIFQGRNLDLCKTGINESHNGQVAIVVPSPPLVISFRLCIEPLETPFVVS